jgi:hypothetical protein
VPVEAERKGVALMSGLSPAMMEDAVAKITKRPVASLDATASRCLYIPIHTLTVAAMAAPAAAGAMATAIAPTAAGAAQRRQREHR